MDVLIFPTPNGLGGVTVSCHINSECDKWKRTGWIVLKFGTLLVIAPVLVSFSRSWDKSQGHSIRKSDDVIIFSWDQAALRMVQSVCLSVCLSFCLLHLFHYVPVIVISKFSTDLFLGRLFNICFPFLSKLIKLEFGEVLHVSIWIAFGMNGVNIITQNALDGLVLDLEQMLVVIVPEFVNFPRSCAKDQGHSIWKNDDFGHFDFDLPNCRYGEVKVWVDVGGEQQQHFLVLFGVHDGKSALVFVMDSILTHLSLDKMAAISQTIFPAAFSWMKSFVFWLKFHWNLLLRVQLTITKHWFR